MHPQSDKYLVVRCHDELCMLVCVGNIEDRFSCDGVHLLVHVIFTNEPRHEKTNVLVSDLVRHKPGCTATEDD